MRSRHFNPPPVHGTWTWLHRLIRAEIQGRGIHRANAEEAFRRLLVMGEQRIEEWCMTRRLVLRIIDGQVEVRPRPSKVKDQRSVPSMQDVKEKGLF